jgi:hypothetical protein
MRAGALEIGCAIAFAKASEQMTTAVSEILESLGIVFVASVPFDSHRECIRRARRSVEQFKFV